MKRLLTEHRRRFGKEFLIAWVFIVGLLASLIALVPSIEPTWLRSAIGFAGSVGLAGAYAWKRTEAIHLLLEEFIPEANECALSVQCPCERGHAQQASQIAARAYCSQPPIDPERYEQWRLKNNRILVCIVDGTDRVLGYFDVLPLRSDFFEQLRSGSVSELDVRFEHVLSTRHVREGTRLYLAGIAVEEPETISGKRNAAILIWSLLKYLEHFYLSTSPHPLIAVGATAEGEHLLRRFGFRLTMSGAERRDGNPLYECVLSRDFIAEASTAVPDWERMVRLSWLADSGGALANRRLQPTARASRASRTPRLKRGR